MRSSSQFNSPFTNQFFILLEVTEQKFAEEKMGLLYPSIEIRLASTEVTTSLTLRVPQSESGQAPMGIDTLLVDNIDEDPYPELIFPAFAGPSKALVGFEAPVWVIDVGPNDFGPIEELTYQSARRALTLDTSGTKKALVFPAFTDVWPETAPGTLFIPSDDGYQKVLLNRLQTHGPSSGYLSPGGQSYVVIPSDWSDQSDGLGTRMAWLSNDGDSLTYTRLGPVAGQEIGGAASAVITSTDKSGSWIFVGQSFVDSANNRSDVIIPIRTLSDGTPVIDSSREVQIFNDYWNLQENQEFAQQYPAIVRYNAENPQFFNDHSHVVTAESADLNGDGLPDVISAHCYRTPSLNLMMLVPYIQQSNGTFTQEAKNTFVDFDYNQDVPYRLFVQDLNQDGHVDITFGSEMWDDTRYPDSPSAGVYLNDGLGNFARAASTDQLLTIFQRSQVAIVENSASPQVIRFDPGWDNSTGNSGPVIRVELLEHNNNFSGPYGTNPALRGAPGFNEWFYLNQNADVAVSVRNGTIDSGLSHFLQVGRDQGRTGFAPGSKVIGSNAIDTVTYNDSKLAHALIKNQAVFAIANGSKLDQLQSIERVKFNDGLVALDIEGNAGTAAKILGALWGKESVENPTFVGIVLHYLDSGVSYEALLDLALGAILGTNKTNEAIVELVFTNLVGEAPTQDVKTELASYIDSGAYSQAGFARAIADLELNATNINLIGLSDTGLQYTEYVP
jgi:hypothetical protein